MKKLVSSRAVIVASLVALLAVCGAVAADYASNVRMLRRLQSSVATRKQELAPLRQYADEVAEYERKRDELQRRSDVITHAEASQTRWQPELAFAERALQLPGVRIDDIDIGPTVELSIRSDSMQHLGDAAKSVQSMTIEDGTETFHPVFAKQPTEIHWSVRLEVEKKK